MDPTPTPFYLLFDTDCKGNKIPNGSLALKSSDSNTGLAPLFGTAQEGSLLSRFLIAMSLTGY